MVNHRDIVRWQTQLENGKKLFNPQLCMAMTTDSMIY